MEELEFRTLTEASFEESLSSDDFLSLEGFTEISDFFKSFLLWVEKDLATTSLECFVFISVRALQASSLVSNSRWQNLWIKSV